MMQRTLARLSKSGLKPLGNNSVTSVHLKALSREREALKCFNKFTDARNFHSHRIFPGLGFSAFQGSIRTKIFLNHGKQFFRGNTTSAAAPEVHLSGGGAEKSATSTFLKWTTRIAATVVGLTALAVLAAPSILSTQKGMEIFLAEANKHLPGRVEIAEARLSWTPVHKPLLTCVKVYDSPRGGTILLHLGSVSGSGALHELVLAMLRQAVGSGADASAADDPYRVTISNPWINAAYDIKYKDFKILHWLEGAGILSPPPTEPLLSDDKTSSVPAKARAAAVVAAAESKVEEAATKGEEEARRLLKRRSAISLESISRVEAELRTRAEDATNEPDESTSAPDSTTSAWIAAVSKAGSESEPSGLKKTPLVAALCRVNNKMGMRLDADVGHLALTIENALLLVPVEVREMVGQDLNVTAAIGRAALQRLAAKEGERAGKEGGKVENVWGADAATRPSEAAAGVAARLELEGVLANGAAAALEPGLVRVASANVRGETRLWKVPSTKEVAGKPSGVMILDAPAEMNVQFTPVASRLLLGGVNPLLASTADLQVGGAGADSPAAASQWLRVRWWPQAQVLPFTEANVQVSPLRVRLQPNAEVITALQTLRVLAAGKEDETKAPAPELSCGPMQFQYSRDGRESITNRVDMVISVGDHSGSIVPPPSVNPEAAASSHSASSHSASSGSSSGGVRLLLWGRSDEQRDEIDSTVGIPIETLRRIPGAGLQHLPDNYVFPLHLRGRVGHPVPQLREAGTRLGALLILETLQKTSLALSSTVAQVPPTDVSNLAEAAVTAAAGGGWSGLIRGVATAVSRRVGSAALDIIDAQLAMATQMDVAEDISAVPAPISDPDAWALAVAPASPTDASA